MSFICNYCTAMWTIFEFDVILFVKVKEDTLLDMVNHMDDRTGVVHQMPFTSDRPGFAATLEKVDSFNANLKKTFDNVFF